MSRELHMRSKRIALDLQEAVYTIRAGDWDRTRQLVTDVLLAINATSTREQELEEPELKQNWRGLRKY